MDPSDLPPIDSQPVAGQQMNKWPGREAPQPDPVLHQMGCPPWTQKPEAFEPSSGEMMVDHNSGALTSFSCSGHET